MLDLTGLDFLGFQDMEWKFLQGRGHAGTDAALTVAVMVPGGDHRGAHLSS